MSDEILVLRRSCLVPDHAAAVAMLVQPVLNDLVGPDTAPVSLGLEYGAELFPGESVDVSARIVTGTRTLVFAQASIVTSTGRMAADISAVFRRLTGPEKETDRAG